MEIEATVFLARFLGSFYLIFGSLFIVTKQLGRTIEMTDDKSFVISTGYITLLMGLATVVLHNVWVADWTVVITLLGWFTLIKGIIKVGFPEQIRERSQMFRNKQAASTVFLMGLGTWLIWMSLF
jgi:hypothetical protein